MKETRINRLEQEINKECDAFIRDLVTEINEMYRARSNTTRNFPENTQS